MPAFTPRQIAAVERLLEALIDQEDAHVIVPPQEASSGFWFGGGDLMQDADEQIWLCGRYRNVGDSRTGLAAGLRGLECAIFRSGDGGETFEKALSWSKADLSRPGRKVLSIEGTSLHQRTDGTVELYISSEKEMDYPEGLAEFQKPGTGVWTIDRISAPSVRELDAANLETVLENADLPEYLHLKDPVVFDAPGGGTAMIFCTHPFCWSSGNSALAVRPAGAAGFEVVAWEMVHRGPAWDVASTRLTGRQALPAVGCFADQPPAAVYFYDGCECVRPLDENPAACKRPRGYSCEELGGAMIGWDTQWPRMSRVSRLRPLFVSPFGTGCSRYVETLITERGILATWQQSQDDLSQPLVGNFLPLAKVEQLLS